MKLIKTEEKTINKKVKSLIIETFKDARAIVKKHISGVGYVHFIKDENRNILGKVYKDGCQISISIN